MSTIPEDYHDFADIFSKSKASKLADHQPYDLKITLDEGTSPPTLGKGDYFPLGNTLGKSHKYIKYLVNLINFDIL